MLEYAAFGFVTLKWWTWPILWAVVMVAVYGAQRLSAWRDRVHEQRTAGVEPCVAYMGTDADDYDHWCWRRDGHDGEHRNLWGVPQSDFDAEPDELDRVADAVKERHPEVPWSELQAPPGLFVPTVCQRSSNCYRPHQHQGPCVLDYSEPEPDPLDLGVNGLCRWGEDGGGNESACWKIEGHAGPHMVQERTDER